MNTPRSRPHNPSSIPGPADRSDPVALHRLLRGFEHAGIDRRGSAPPESVTLWSEHDGLSTGAEAVLVGSRPGNVLIVVADFAMNQGQQLMLDKRLSVQGLPSRAACHVLSSRPGMRACDLSRASYVLELQRERA